MKGKERILWIDTLKGLLLVFICLSHFGELPDYVTLLIKPTGSFWVPFFFIFSGFLFTPVSNLASYIKRKSKTLLLPYLFFSVAFILIDHGTYTDAGSLAVNLQRVFIESIGPAKASPLWFV